jgi:ubiquinone/menaquinone biosynthesis C-methylase UbiE
VVLDNLESKPIDLVKLSFEDNSIASLSCMHTIEHIGLGRYGDPLDYDGDLKAIDELKRVTANGGNLLVVLPLGAESKIAFNAHRIYKHADVIQLFSGFTLKEFALISDNKNENGLIYQANEDVLNRQKYGCGCYWFEKEN